MNGVKAGVYADSDFGEGELVLKDQILVGAQHSSNKVLFVCISIFLVFVAFFSLFLLRLVSFPFLFHVSDRLLGV